jgi:Thioredoxin
MQILLVLLIVNISYKVIYTQLTYIMCTASAIHLSRHSLILGISSLCINCYHTYRDASERYSVSSMPTFVFIKNGKVLDTIKGADEATLKAKLKSLS